MSIKDGKKPLAQRPAPSNFLLSDDVFGNVMAISPEIKAELAEKGLEGRWLNARKLTEMQGYHAKGWAVYRRDKTASGIMDFKFGNDPEGIVRRGDCILGVKTKEQADMHRKVLDQKAKRGYNIQSDKASELRDSIRASGGKASVLEGYDDNE